MPLYDYQCDQCGHRFEVRQGIREDPLTECPQCGGRIRRVIHPVGIVFKGSGFYVTDSRKQSSATMGSGSSGADKDKKTESSPNGDATSAPAAKASESAPSAATSSGSSSSGSSGGESKGSSGS